MFYTYLLFFYRKCVNNQVFYRKGDPHPYCKNACEDRTMCGEVQVPEEHLEVSYITYNVEYIMSS